MRTCYFLPVLAGATCLACSREPEPEPIDYSHVADFTYAGVLNVKEPITFSSTSPHAQGHRWSFGDGTTLPGTGQYPVHAFARAGTYPVKLTVSYGNGTIATSTQQLTIIQPDTLGPYFAAVVGEYRLTKQYSSTGGTAACDILVTTSRTGDRLALSTQGVGPSTYPLDFSPPGRNPAYYSFVWYGPRYASQSATFKVNSDSIVINSTVYNPSSGSIYNRWWGKRR